MSGLNAALSEVKERLLANRRASFETRVETLREQHESALAFEEHSLEEDLAEIERLFEGDNVAPAAKPESAATQN